MSSPVRINSLRRQRRVNPPDLRMTPLTERYMGRRDFIGGRARGVKGARSANALTPEGKSVRIRARADSSAGRARPLQVLTTQMNPSVDHRFTEGFVFVWLAGVG